MITDSRILLSEDKFRVALKEWLSGQVTGHLGPYMYSDDQDDQRWKSGHSAKNYYLGADDKATFDIALQGLEISTQNLLDLGPGGEAAITAKTIPLLSKIRANYYFPVDLSNTLAEFASIFVEKQLHVPGEKIVSDFFESLGISKPNSLLAFMGGTLGNLETHFDAVSLSSRIEQIFRDFRHVVPGKSYFLVSFDANQNSTEVIECYDNPEFGDLIRSCVEREVDTAGFDYHVTWTDNTYRLSTGLKARYDQTIRYDGQSYSLSKDEFLPVLNSYRFPVDFVKGAADRAGWAFLNRWSASRRVNYLLFERK